MALKVDQVFPEQQVRQLLPSVPYLLRFLFANPRSARSSGAGYLLPLAHGLHRM